MTTAKYVYGGRSFDEKKKYYEHLAEFKNATDKGYFVVIAPPIELEGRRYGYGSKIAVYVRDGQKVLFAVIEYLGELDWGACSPRPVGAPGEENLWVACREGFFDYAARLRRAE